VVGAAVVCGGGRFLQRMGWQFRPCDNACDQVHVQADTFDGLWAQNVPHGSQCKSGWWCLGD